LLTTNLIFFAVPIFFTFWGITGTIATNAALETGAAETAVDALSISTHQQETAALTVDGAFRLLLLRGIDFGQDHVGLDLRVGWSIHPSVTIGLVVLVTARIFLDDARAETEDK